MRIGSGTVVVPTPTASVPAAVVEAPETKKTFTAEEKLTCSIEAMRNGGECEACQ
jgi:ribonucleoside-diphosphate reductase alpha chain